MNSVLEKFRKAMLKKGYSVVRASVMDKVWMESEGGAERFEVVVELFKGVIRVRVNGKIVQGTRRMLSWISTVVRKGIKFECVEALTIGREAASALHKLIGGSGISNHYAFAENILGRLVRSFTDLSLEDEQKIRRELIAAFRGAA